MGSRLYIPPEMICGREYDYKVDIWSASCVLYFLAFGVMPYNGDTLEEVAFDINKKDIKNQLKHQMLFTDEFTEFISLGLEKNPEKRGSCKQMLSCYWLCDLKIPQ